MRLLSVVLSGGVGSRLWPASRQAFPKPFMKLGGSTLLQQAIERGQACGADERMVATRKDHLFPTRDVLRAMGNAPRSSFLLKPVGRNTGPAVAPAAPQCERQFGGEYHHQRAEHWGVVRGKAIVQGGEVEHETLPGQYRYIPLQEKHRPTDIGTDEPVLIEAQCGGYLGEDDIVRMADTCGRA